MWKDAAHVDRYLTTTMSHAPAVAATHDDVLRQLVRPGTRRILDLAVAMDGSSCTVSEVR